MPSIVERLILVCEQAFGVVEAKVPPPSWVSTTVGPTFRTVEKTAEQAIIQKLARLITSMRATLRLLESGLYQEVGVMFRILDEISEDITFLGQVPLNGCSTPLHQEYLDSFYQEEFDDPKNPMASSQNRPTVSRRRIHAALAALPESPMNQSDAQELRQTLNKTFSGYVHGASHHILEMYGGNPPRFHLSGMLGTPRQPAFEKHALQYFYRGLLTTMYVALAFKETTTVQDMYAFRSEFERLTGMTDWPDPDKRIRELRRGGA
jgi:hypothetical protein